MTNLVKEDIRLRAAQLAYDITKNPVDENTYQKNLHHVMNYLNFDVPKTDNITNGPSLISEDKSVNIHNKSLNLPINSKTKIPLLLNSAQEPMFNILSEAANAMYGYKIFLNTAKNIGSTTLLTAFSILFSYKKYDIEHVVHNKKTFDEVVFMLRSYLKDVGIENADDKKNKSKYTHRFIVYWNDETVQPLSFSTIQVVLPSQPVENYIIDEEMNPICTSANHSKKIKILHNAASIPNKVVRSLLSDHLSTMIIQSTLSDEVDANRSLFNELWDNSLNGSAIIRNGLYYSFPYWMASQFPIQQQNNLIRNHDIDIFIREYECIIPNDEYKKNFIRNEILNGVNNFKQDIIKDQMGVYPTDAIITEEYMQEISQIVDIAKNISTEIDDWTEEDEKKFAEMKKIAEKHKKENEVIQEQIAKVISTIEPIAIADERKEAVTLNENDFKQVVEFDKVINSEGFRNEIDKNWKLINKIDKANKKPALLEKGSEEERNYFKNRISELEKELANIENKRMMEVAGNLFTIKTK